MSLPEIRHNGFDVIEPSPAAADMIETRRASRLARAESTSPVERHASNDKTDDEVSSVIRLSDIAQGGRLSLPRISLESYILGILLGAGISLSPYLLLLHQTPLWRTPAFLAILSIFHFTEFYTYARWNIKNTKADSFLTFWNGRAYPIAMAVGLLETTTTSLFFPQWQALWSNTIFQLTGLVLVAVGQYMRHAAIATAGASFNHIVQQQKREDHVLITWGPYAWCRHPSYFGFYWWAVGSQVLIGNVISTPLFAFILWRFFWRRIPIEETALIEMFGDEYKQFRAKRSIGIPFMASAVDKALINIATRRQRQQRGATFATRSLDH